MVDRCGAGEREAGRRRPWRVAILAAGLAAALAALHFTPLSRYLGDVEAIRSDLRETGAFAPLAFVGGSALLAAAGAPRLALCVLAGMLFGFVRGLVWSQAGTILGAYACFVFIRWGGRDWASRRIARFGSAARWFEETPTFWTVFLLRQAPLASILVNSILAVSHVRHRDFLAGSFVGFLPGAIVANLVGSGFVRGSLQEALPRILAAAGAFLLFAWLAARFRKRRT